MVRVVANIISKVISNNIRNSRASYSERILDHYENPRNVVVHHMIYNSWIIIYYMVTRKLNTRKYYAKKKI